jgi:hypothetical protein
MSDESEIRVGDQFIAPGGSHLEIRLREGKPWVWWLNSGAWSVINDADTVRAWLIAGKASRLPRAPEQEIAVNSRWRRKDGKGLGPWRVVACDADEVRSKSESNPLTGTYTTAVSWWREKMERLPDEPEINVIVHPTVHKTHPGANETLPGLEPTPEQQKKIQEKVDRKLAAAAAAKEAKEKLCGRCEKVEGKPTKRGRFCEPCIAKMTAVEDRFRDAPKRPVCGPPRPMNGGPGVHLQRMP